MTDGARIAALEADENAALRRRLAVADLDAATAPEVVAVLHRTPDRYIDLAGFCGRDA